MEKYSTSARLLSEIANKLKTGFTTLCCRLEALFPRYNTPVSYYLDSSTATTSITIPANTAHYISYSIIQGSADVTIGTNPTNNIPACFSETLQATDVITQDVTIEAVAVSTTDGIVYITVMEA
jgi:hypothetical protein